MVDTFLFPWELRVFSQIFATTKSLGIFLFKLKILIIFNKKTADSRQYFVLFDFD